MKKFFNNIILGVTYCFIIAVLLAYIPMLIKASTKIEIILLSIFTPLAISFAIGFFWYLGYSLNKSVE